MQPSITTHPPRRRFTAWAAIAALTLSGAASWTAPTAQAAETTYPWSKVASTGDYIADSYADVDSGHVLENLTTDRLLDVLSSNGNYYILFAGPEHPASQALLGTINEQAKAHGITKIYHFDPYVDGYQLDATLANGVADITGGTSVNFGGTAKLSDVWKLITNLLPASAIAPGGALHDYAGNTALLLNVEITNRKDVDAGKTVTKLAEVTEADAAAFAADTAGVKTATAAALATAFDGRTSSVRSQFDFFERLYNASATKTEGTNETADRIGGPVTIFDAADYPNAADFRLKSIDVKELYNLLNSPGEFPILFAGQGCHNTQAIIGSVAERAKELNTPVVYVVDFALDSNVKFGTGDEIDTALGNSATGGLWIRSGSAALATSSPYRYGYSYLYGKIAEYFGPEWITENSSKRNNSVAYYPNAVLGEPSSVNPYADGFDPATQAGNATRLQVPTLVRYNKDAADGPIVSHWLHTDQVAEGAPQTYTEYMLELAWVWRTAKNLADTGRSTGRNGLTKAEFAAEAVTALKGVLTGQDQPDHTFTTVPKPTIDGQAKVGGTLEGFWDEWSHNPTLTYQWLADGAPIPGATSDVYTVTAQDAGKKVSFALTGTRAGYQPVTSVSDAFTIGALSKLKKTPAPKITGTAKVGKKLRVKTGTWSPKVAFSYQWNADGEPIADATKSSYKIAPELVGKKITVTVTGAKANYTTVTKASKATKKVAALTFSKKPAPKIKGKAVVGNVLTAKPGSWSPKSGTTFSYGWYAAGQPIEGATDLTFTLTEEHLGKKITFKVTATKPGYKTVTKTAKATAKVR